MGCETPISAQVLGCALRRFGGLAVGRRPGGRGGGDRQYAGGKPYGVFMEGLAAHCYPQPQEFMTMAAFIKSN